MQASLYLTAKKIAYQVNIKHVKLLYQLKFAFSACYDNKKKQQSIKLAVQQAQSNFLVHRIPPSIMIQLQRVYLER